MKLPKYNVENLHVEDYWEVFDTDESVYGDSKEEIMEKLRDRQLSKYRVKTIRSGNMLEVEAYPIWATSGKRGKRSKGNSTEAQQNLNDKNTKKRLIRLVNTNFTDSDIWATLTYENGRLPADHQQAKKDMQNYIRRLKRWLKKNHGTIELKYIYVTEYENDEKKGKVRVHHHIIYNFPDRDIAEDLWKGGGRSQTRRLKSDDFGLEGLTRYITKDKKKDPSKRYTVSRNLKQPKVTIADSKMTRKRGEKIALQEICAEEVFEKMYKDYSFNDIEVKFSEFVSGAYLYVRMKKKESLVKNKRRLDP